MYRTLLKKMRPLDPVRVENRCGAGTPDINFVGGWMEAKWLPRWPKNCDTSAVLVPQYTRQQRVWAARREAKGGRVWFLFKVGQDWLLFFGGDARVLIGHSTRTVLLQNCARHWKSALVGEELCGLLFQKQE